MNDNLLYITVLLEGLLSFSSPCVLPLIPAYLTYLAGQSADDMLKGNGKNRSVIINSIGFIFGFSIIFILLGAAATSLGRFLRMYQGLIIKISGVAIIIFGLFHSGLFSIPFLNYEKRLNINPKSAGFFHAILMGMAFSIGWTPCVGPVLASVLIMAGNAQTISKGILLLALYSLGIGIPFFIMSIAIKYIWEHIRGLYKYMDTIKIISGVILIIIGFMMFIGRF